MNFTYWLNCTFTSWNSFQQYRENIIEAIAERLRASGEWKPWHMLPKDYRSGADLLRGNEGLAYIFGVFFINQRRPRSPTTRMGLLKNHRRLSGARRRASCASKIGRAAADTGTGPSARRRVSGPSIREVSREKTARSELQPAAGTFVRRQSFRGVTGNAIAMSLINDPGAPRLYYRTRNRRENRAANYNIALWTVDAYSP